MLRDVHFKLPPETIDGLRALAEERDVTPGQLVRDLLGREIARRPAKRSDRTDEQRVARLQGLLAEPIAEARSWRDLERRLADLGYALRPAGGGLTLHDATGQRLCKASELGFAYSRLVKRFGEPMPGHPHRMAHLFTKRAAGPPPDDPVFFEAFDDG